MLNHCIIMGRLTRDPELRRTQGDVPVAGFTLACERDYRDRNGDKQVDFIDVVCWRSTAEFVGHYFTKGRMAVAEGRLQIRNWEDDEGHKRRNAEIVAENVYFADSRKDAGEQAETGGARDVPADEGDLPF